MAYPYKAGWPEGDGQMTRQFNRANQNRRTGSQAKAGVTSRGKTGEMEPPSGAGRQEERRKNRRKKQRQMHLLMLALVIVVGIGILAAALRKNGEQIFVDDTYAVTIRRGKVTAEDFTKSVEAQLAASLGTSVQINETITFTPVRASKEDIVTTEYALSTVCSMVTYQVEAAVVTVDGGEVLALATEQEAQSVLDQIINEYIPEGTEVAEKGFVENVEIRKKFVDSRQIVSTEQAYATLTAGTPATETYTVTSGDTLSIIASKNNIAVEDILEANPTMTITTPLQIGDKLNLNVTVPYLSVKTAENVVYTDVQEKEVEYREDATKPAGYRKVVQQGRDGQKEVTSQVIRVNGFETEQKVISETTTVEPVTEIIVVGTAQ